MIYHARPYDALACANQVDEIEADLSALWDYFGVPSTERLQVEWYRFADAADWAGKRAGICAPEAAGCSNGVVFFAPVDSFEHEFVHAALFGAGWPPRLFAEGAAVGLTCDPREGELLSAPGEGWRGSLDAQANRDGAELVTHLLAEYGPERLRALFGALARNASTDDVATTFQQIYGASLDDVWAATRSDPNRRYCAPFWTCRDAAVRSGNVELGPRCASLHSGVRLPDDVGVSLTAQSGMAIVRPCDALSADYSAPPEGLIGAPGAETWFFPAGRDFALQKWGSDVTTTFALRPLDGVAGANCTAPAPLVVDGPAWHRRLWMPPIQAPLFLSLDVSAPGALTWSSPSGPLLPGQDAWLLEACSACANGQVSGCTAYHTANADARVWLRVTWQPSAALRTLRAELAFN